MDINFTVQLANNRSLELNNAFFFEDIGINWSTHIKEIREEQQQIGLVPIFIEKDHISDGQQLVSQPEETETP